MYLPLRQALKLWSSEAVEDWLLRAHHDPEAGGALDVRARQDPKEDLNPL